MDPRFKGKNLDANDFAEGSEYITNFYEKFKVNKEKLIKRVIDFNAETGEYAHHFMQFCQNLVDWNRVVEKHIFQFYFKKYSYRYNGIIMHFLCN